MVSSLRFDKDKSVSLNELTCGTVSWHPTTPTACAVGFGSTLHLIGKFFKAKICVLKNTSILYEFMCSFILMNTCVCVCTHVLIRIHKSTTPTVCAVRFVSTLYLIGKFFCVKYMYLENSIFIYMSLFIFRYVYMCVCIYWYACIHEYISI
jgi:hypothetical protein